MTIQQSVIDRAARKMIKTPCRNKVGVIVYDKHDKYKGIMINIPRFSRKGGGIHAEINALSRYFPNIGKLVLLRCNKHGKLLPIHPCSTCQDILDKLGIPVYLIEHKYELVKHKRSHV